jgi:arsenate reductase-like glutaredoxin family protein
MLRPCMKKACFIWKSTCSTCRDARKFLRDELGVVLDERDYAKQPFSIDELTDLFKDSDPRDYLNPRSPAFKAMHLAGKTLSPADALRLMTEESNLIKRPIVISGHTIIAGFDLNRYRELLS